ncbi:unnamed protein product [Lactuca virosa]|uniref:Uncharacterized protein n=1 Tax=Lactuca virosa TaxID=75947 RepID=A0AAU9MIT9_9ASTR|nr:unnamed protein product [Lactuca virosa]
MLEITTTTGDHIHQVEPPLLPTMSNPKYEKNMFVLIRSDGGGNIDRWLVAAKTHIIQLNRSFSTISKFITFFTLQIHAHSPPEIQI